MAVWCLLSSDCDTSEWFLSLGNTKFLDRTKNGLICEVSIKWFKLFCDSNWVVFVLFHPLMSQAHSKLATCQTCKTLIKTGEVLHGLGVGGVMGSYCSVNCLNKGKLTTASFIRKEPDHTTVPATCWCCSFYCLCCEFSLKLTWIFYMLGFWDF